MSDLSYEEVCKVTLTLKKHSERTTLFLRHNDMYNYKRELKLLIEDLNKDLKLDKVDLNKEE